MDDPLQEYDTLESGHEGAPGNSHLPKHVSVIALALLAVFVVTFGIWYYLVAYKGSSPTSKTPATPDTLDALEGAIFLTLMPLDTRESNVYRYDFNTGNLTVASEEFLDADYMRYTGSVSHSGEKIAYFLSPRVDDETLDYPFASPLQLLTFPFDNPDGWTVLTEEQSYLKLNPRWSPADDRIAYEAFVGDFADPDAFLDNDSWRVFITETGKESGAEEIGMGSSPQWSKDGGEVIYVRSDGLYLYSHDTQMSDLVMAFEDTATRQTRIDVSFDGNTLVITDEAKRIDVYDVTSWNPFEVSLKDSITVPDTSEVLWPTLSPSAEYVAVLEEDSVDPTQYNRAFLSVYEIEGGRKQRVMEISTPFLPDHAFLSDWR